MAGSLPECVCLVAGRAEVECEVWENCGSHSLLTLGPAGLFSHFPFTFSCFPFHPQVPVCTCRKMPLLLMCVLFQEDL